MATGITRAGGVGQVARVNGTAGSGATGGAIRREDAFNAVRNHTDTHTLSGNTELAADLVGEHDGVALRVYRARVMDSVARQADELNEGKIGDSFQAADGHARLHDASLGVRDLDGGAGGAQLAQVVVGDLGSVDVDLNLGVLVDAQQPAMRRVADGF